MTQIILIPFRPQKNCPWMNIKSTKEFILLDIFRTFCVDTPFFGRVGELDGLLFCQRDTFIPPITSIYTYWNQWKHWAMWIFIDQKPIKKDTNITRVIDLIMHTLTLILLYCNLLCLKALCIFNYSCHILNLDNLYIFLNKYFVWLYDK